MAKMSSGETAGAVAIIVFVAAAVYVGGSWLKNRGVIPAEWLGVAPPKGG